MPGFGLTMGSTLFYLCAIVLIPLAALVVRALHISWADFWHLTTTDRALAAYKVTFGASLIAALVNAAFGTLLAWVLVRYEFPGRRFIDAMVDFPFALPTAVAGSAHMRCRERLARALSYARSASRAPIRNLAY